MPELWLSINVLCMQNSDNKFNKMICWKLKNVLSEKDAQTKFHQNEANEDVLNSIKEKRTLMVMLKNK